MVQNNQATKQASDLLEITNLLANNMNTNFGTYGDDRKLNNLCTNICQRINRYIGDYNMVDVSMITYFLDFLTYSRVVYFGGNKPILSLGRGSYKLDDIISTLLAMSEYINISEMDNIIDRILCSHDNVSFFIKLYSDQGCQLPVEVLEESCRRKLYNNIKNICTYFPNIIKEDNVNHIITNGVYDSDTQMIYGLLNLKYSITRQSLKQLMVNGCFNSEQTLKLFKTIVLTGIKIDDDILEYACMYKKYQIIEFLLMNDIKPTKKCFDNILGSGLSGSYANSHDKESCIALLTKYGYELTYKDFLEATRSKLTVKNLEKYNFQITQEFMGICSEVGFYPNYGSINLVPDPVCIENECKRAGGVDKIRKLVGMGCKVSPKALENACEHKNNMSTLRYLAQNGATVTPKALLNMAHASGNSGMIYIAELFSSQEKDRELKQQKQQNNAVSVSIEFQDSKNNNDGSNVFYVDYSDDDDDESDGEDSSDSESGGEVPSEEPIIEQKVEQTKYDIHNLNGVQLVGFQTTNIPSSVNKSLSISEKQSTCYMDIRKKIFEYLLVNKLFNIPDQKNIFTLDKKMADLSGIKKESYISFNDFDKFISKIITHATKN